MKKLQELEAVCVESRQTNLFFIDPKMSYPPEAFVKADPDFWLPAAKKQGVFRRNLGLEMRVTQA